MGQGRGGPAAADLVGGGGARRPASAGSARVCACVRAAAG